MKWGILFRWGSWWIGGHWSDHNKRLCFNPLPMVTVWITAEGGETPDSGYGFDIWRSDKAGREWEKLRDAEKRSYAIAFATAAGVITKEQFDLLRQLVEQCIEHDISLEDFKRMTGQILQPKKEDAP